jgi:6-pyruvoyl-tetrahydropterin synthase related domain
LSRFPIERGFLGKTIAVTRPLSAAQSSQTSLLWTPLLAIATAACAVEIPFLFFGTPSGHDVEFHLYSWLEVLSQWRHGILYPRWAGLAHFGYGEPRFVFYPPASWMLGSLISAIFPWRAAASIYIWVALVAAGCSMFVVVRRWFDRRDATFAAVLYAVSPYHLVIVYWRSSFAELLAATLVPLLLLLILKAADRERRVIVPLALVLAAAWLTNAPAAVMIHYSLALLIAFFAWQRRSASPLLIPAVAVALGAALAAFYLLPAIYEQKWVNIAEAVSAGSRPADNFLFIHTTDADHDAFNRIISWVAVLEIGALFVAAGVGRLWKETYQQVWKALAVWATACGLLMLPFSLVLWKILPKLQFMQFPWRWLLCVSLVFTLFVSVGLRRWWQRGVVCVVSLLIIVLAWHGVQAPWWDASADLREMRDNMSDRIGYEGTDEYTPAGADPSGIDKEARNVTVDGPAKAAIHVHSWDAQSKSFTAEVSAPDRLALKLFPYPAWLVIANGRQINPEHRSGSGQMLIPVAAGTNNVEIRFVRTWDRTAGGWISLLTLAGIVGFTFRGRRYRR